ACDLRPPIYSITSQKKLNNSNRAEAERICWDSKDGELYLSRMKPEETQEWTKIACDLRPPIYSTTSQKKLNNSNRAEIERICWDPKDGELYLSRMKPEETQEWTKSGQDKDNLC
uniref:EIF2A domain-containing protein n=1 Tax=Ascaris lumbricoides TaxID=6252 RepID=A0A0M3I9P0_ASCLU